MKAADEATADETVTDEATTDETAVEDGTADDATTEGKQQKILRQRNKGEKEDTLSLLDRSSGSGRSVDWLHENPVKNWFYQKRIPRQRRRLQLLCRRTKIWMKCPWMKKKQNGKRHLYQRMERLFPVLHIQSP